MNEIIRDGGIKSRKLWFSVFVVVTMFGGAAVCAKWPALVPLYDTFVGGIVAVTGLFLTGNIANKWVGIKTLPQATPAPAPEPKAAKAQDLAAEESP